MTPDYDKETLKKAQQASLEILLAVDRICRDNGIHYLLDAGTLLGAVRHQGFIPWDDDIDIAMLRTEYEKLLLLLRPDRAAGAVGDGKTPQVRLPENMELILPDEYQSGNAFYDFTPRIIYKNSRRHADGAEMDYYDGKLNHLWVDIFILDNIPDNALKDKCTRFLQKCIYGFSMPKRYGLNMNKYKGMERLMVGTLSAVGRLFPMPRLFSMQERLSKKYENRRTKRLYYSNYQPDYMHDTIDREWSGETAELLFEGHRMMVPENYDAVLREIYGDYMKLPPEEQRVPSHSDGIDVWEEAPGSVKNGDVAEEGGCGA
ncbi:MAG: LicD family protein [Eubacteriales bacterium]|nr:LicD family protein [Eubacteriales bacterium]